MKPDKMPDAQEAKKKPNAKEFYQQHIKWLGHAGFLIDAKKTIYIDPFRLNEIEQPLPSADYIFITSSRPDHLEPASIRRISTPETTIYGPFVQIHDILPRSNIIHIGHSVAPDGATVTAVPSLTLARRFGTTLPQTGEDELGEFPYDPVGYVMYIDGKVIYHAGRTDPIKEMSLLPPIDIALLPIGGKYTMGLRDAAKLVKKLQPKLTVPMHYNTSLDAELVGQPTDGLEFQLELSGSGFEVLVDKPINPVMRRSFMDSLRDLEHIH